VTEPLALARARRALEDAGLDASVPLERADSVTNEVWLAPEWAIRVNRTPDRRLRREAWLGPRLPADVGYPRTVAYGGELGADWLVVERRPGTVLSRAWPGMDRDARRRATAQLATLLRRLHDTPTPVDLPPTTCPQLVSTTTLPSVSPLLDGLDRLAGAPHVEPGLVAELRGIVESSASAIEPFSAQHLIHGDLHFENVLWDGYVITALLDFEYSRGAPADLELDVLLRFCAFPHLHVAPDYEDRTRAEDYAEIPWWLAEDYPELFDHPQLLERLRTYCIAYDVRDLLANPMRRPARELSPHHPHNRLEAVARGRCHLDLFSGRTSSFQLSQAERLAATGHPDGVVDRLAPLAPGASEERRRSTGPAISLPRRRGAPDPPADAAGSDRPADDHEPERRAPVAARIDGGALVVEQGGRPRWEGRVRGGHARQVELLEDEAIVVVLDWAEEHLPEGYDRFSPFPNVVCLGPDGAERWTAELPPREKCFVGVRVDGDRLVGLGWSWQCDLDPASGRSGTPVFTP
jgi:hypothetical protein